MRIQILRWRLVNRFTLHQFALQCLNIAAEDNKLPMEILYRRVREQIRGEGRERQRERQREQGERERQRDDDREDEATAEPRRKMIFSCMYQFG